MSLWRFVAFHSPLTAFRFCFFLFQFATRAALALFFFVLYSLFLRKSFLFFAFVRALCPRACVCEIKVVTLHRVLWALGNEYCNKPSASRPNRTTEWLNREDITPVFRYKQLNETTDTKYHHIYFLSSRTSAKIGTPTGSPPRWSRAGVGQL